MISSRNTIISQTFIKDHASWIDLLNHLGNMSLRQLLCVSFYLVLLIYQLNNVMVECHPYGAPTTACRTMRPQHRIHSMAVFEEDPPPYSVSAESTFVIDDSNKRLPCLNVTLEADEEDMAFRGFLIQGIQFDSGSRIIGSFRFVDADTGSSMDCLDGFDNAVTHINNEEKMSVSFLWFPPTNFTGRVLFVTSVVQDYTIFWVGVNSPPFNVTKGWFGVH